MAWMFGELVQVDTSDLARVCARAALSRRYAQGGLGGATFQDRYNDNDGVPVEQACARAGVPSRYRHLFCLGTGWLSFGLRSAGGPARAGGRRRDSASHQMRFNGAAPGHTGRWRR